MRRRDRPPATPKRQTKVCKRNALGELRALMQTIGVEASAAIVLKLTTVSKTFKLLPSRPSLRGKSNTEKAVPHVPPCGAP